jgi:hypothetical protein
VNIVIHTNNATETNTAGALQSILEEDFGNMWVGAVTIVEDGNG